jgi:hypothetical protein
LVSMLQKLGLGPFLKLFGGLVDIVHFLINDAVHLFKKIDELSRTKKRLFNAEE